MTTLPPIRREILVDAEPGRAFAVFTDDIGRWWPLAELSVHGAGSTVAFEDGVIIERSPEGDEAVWGSVTRWEPGQAVAFTWHPGKAPEAASAVTVTFDGRGEQTLVVLEHTGWEVFADPAGARSEYDHGWPPVLGHYQALVARDAPATWVALVHAPGPSAPVGTSLFADPRFGEHLAFLGRLQERGYLVAAGPLADTDGGGMTILRLPGEGRLAEATKLATEDDAAVAGGLLSVTVRLWQVMVHTLG